MSLLLKISVICSAFYSLNCFSGSYMICVNSNDKTDWKWAPPISKFDHAMWGNGNTFIPENSSGTWLAGDAALNKYGHLVLDAGINKKLFTLERAKLFCENLKKHCQKLGEQFSHIGVSTYSIPPGLNGYISFTYHENYYTEEKSTTCPNWEYKEFPNDGGALGIF